jgi:hypothetical protein
MLQRSDEEGEEQPGHSTMGDITNTSQVEKLLRNSRIYNQMCLYICTYIYSRASAAFYYLSVTK